MPPTVAVCQMAVEDLAVATNYEHIHARISELDETVALAVFPEFALTGFVADERVSEAALSRDSAPIQNLRALATEEELALVFGFVEVAGDAYYNATAYIGPDGELTIYRKRHLWDEEARVLAAGSGRVTVDSPVGKAGLLTCYDLNFVEESVAFTSEDVRALLVVGAWPAAYSENWRLLVRARALDGVRWVIGASRTGQRDLPEVPAATFAGRSLVARPDGVVHQALDRQERTLVTDIDSEVLAKQREIVNIFNE
jgi:(R)-amidase